MICGWLSPQMQNPQIQRANCLNSSFWEKNWNREDITALWFPCASAGKESACNAGGLGLIPGLGWSPGEGKGYPLQYSGLENSMDCIVHGVAKSRTWLSNFHFDCSIPQAAPETELSGLAGEHYLPSQLSPQLKGFFKRNTEQNPLMNGGQEKSFRFGAMPCTAGHVAWADSFSKQQALERAFHLPSSSPWLVTHLLKHSSTTNIYWGPTECQAESQKLRLQQRCAHRADIPVWRWLIGKHTNDEWLMLAWLSSLGGH